MSCCCKVLNGAASPAGLLMWHAPLRALVTSHLQLANPASPFNCRRPRVQSAQCCATRAPLGSCCMSCSRPSKGSRPLAQQTARR